MYKLIFQYQVRLCRGCMDSLCMDCAEVSWLVCVPIGHRGVSMLLVPRFPARRHSVHLQVQVLLQESKRCIRTAGCRAGTVAGPCDDDCVFRGKAELAAKAVMETERRLKHKLLPSNAWRLIEYFNLLMSNPKDYLHHCSISSVLVLICISKV